jgi:site-specific recombinase XerD
MVTLSKPISAGQAQAYHKEEFANAKENYYTEGERVRGEWQGQLAERWGLQGEVQEQQFARLSEGQHPTTGEQLVRHQTAREYEIELLYSTGVRRMEVIALKLYDLSFDRGVLLVRQGKGKKDRYVPIGERAIAWVQKYINEARPQLVSEPDDMTLFLTASGEPFSRDHMTSNVKARICSSLMNMTPSGG